MTRAHELRFKCYKLKQIHTVSNTKGWDPAKSWKQTTNTCNSQETDASGFPDPKARTQITKANITHSMRKLFLEQLQETHQHVCTANAEVSSGTEQGHHAAIQQQQ